jgi:asparagine synthetase B (glutamine-hydrolysing)
MNRVRHFFLMHHADAAPAVADPASVRALVADLPLGGREQWQVHASGPFVFGWLGSASLSKNDPFACYAGTLTGNSSAATAAHLLEAEPTDLPLDGAFAALAVDVEREKAAIATDRFGLFPCYVHEADGITTYATSLRVLTALRRPSCRIDPAAVYEMLGVNLVLGDRTFLREIRLVPAASIVRLDDTLWRRSPTWDWKRIRPTGGGDLVERTYALIEEAVLDAVRGAKQVALPLSGGLDSRMLAAVLAKNGVPVRTYNIDFGRETPIARRVAETLRIPLVILPMRPDPARILSEAHDAIDCLYDVNQTWGWELSERAAADGCDLVLDGLAFDAILGAVHRVEGGDAAALARSLAANYQTTDFRSFECVAGPAARAIQDSLDASLLAAAREAQDAAGELASEYFVMLQRVRKYTYGWGLANAHFLPGAYPFVTRKLFEHCMGLPAEERREHQLYRRIYRERFPELARIPWAKTGRPLDQYGPAESSRAYCLFQAVVRRLTFGRCAWFECDSIDIDFRCRPDFRAAILRRLGGRPAPDLAGTIPESLIPNLLEQQGWGRNFGDLLLTLFTVENFLARFVHDGPCRWGEAGPAAERGGIARPLVLR